VLEAAGLTGQQRRFVEAYLSGCSATEAAQRSGSRASNLRQAGHEMLKARPIRTVIDAVGVAVRNQNWLWRATRMASFVEILDADLADIFDGHCLRPFLEWPAVWQSGALIKLPVSKQTLKGGHSFNLKFIDRTPLLEMVGMLVGAFDASHHPRKATAPDDAWSRRLERASKVLYGSSES